MGVMPVYATKHARKVHAKLADLSLLLIFVGVRSMILVCSVRVVPNISSEIRWIAPWPLRWILVLVTSLLHFLVWGSIVF